MKVTSSGLRIGEQEIPLMSGEIQFWRLEVSDWEPCLLQLKELGLNIAATYISWRRHTKAPGVYDFSGETDARLNVRHFLDLCRKHDMWVHFKPGPWICAEEINGGYPDFLIENDELLAVDSQDRIIRGYNPPFQSPIPSYGHPQYRAHARRWMLAVKEELAGYFYPKGPIIMVQLDNEPSMTFHDRMFEGDYNRSITGEDGLFAGWLRQKYGAEAASFAAPRSFDGIDAGNIQRLFDWVEFKEYLLQEHISFLKDVFHDESMDVLYTVNANEHPQLATPNNWQRLQSASGLVGYDYYFIPPLQRQDCAKMALAISYNRAVSPLAWAPELMSGIWISPGVDEDHPGFTLADLEFYQMCGFALGLKGANFYMAVNRENWADAPVTCDGTRGSTYDSVRNLLELCAGIPDFYQMEMKPGVGVVYQRRAAQEDYIAGSTEINIDGCRLGYGYRNFIDVFQELFYRNCSPAVIDFAGESVHLERYGLVFYTPGEMSSEQALDALLAYAANGGTLVILTAKSVDIDGVPDGEGMFTYGAGRVFLRRLTVESGTAGEAAAQAIEQAGYQALIGCDCHDVIVTVHEHKRSAVCFIVNLNEGVVSCSLNVALPGVTGLVSVVEPGIVHEIAEGRLDMVLPGHSVQVYLLN